MPSSIQQSPHPLAFKVAGGESPRAGGELAVRVEVRALEGMQKEALVRFAGDAWRLVSDEGPYLNGTDLAPFPLAFFTAGTQLSLLSMVARGARARGLGLRGLRVVQDDRYSMSGSFLRGDVRGGALPAEVRVLVESDAPAVRLRPLLMAAAREHAAHPVTRDPLENAFSLVHNGRACALDGLRAAEGAGVTAPEPRLEALRPDSRDRFLPDIVRKGEAAAVSHGVEGGAGSSLHSEQKRTLHVHGEARLCEGLLMETRIDLHKPIGSRFFFRADEPGSLGGSGLAPPPLAYAAAGVGFCYMTQLGRYAHILGWSLDSYAIVQESRFRASGSVAAGGCRSEVSPFATHVFVSSGRSDEEAVRLVEMGERTCFLHAAMRGAFPSRVRFELNGRPLD